MNLEHSDIIMIQSFKIFARCFSTHAPPVETSFSPDAISSTAEWYIKHSYKASNKIYSAMVPFLKLDSAHSILDAGGGAGNGVEVMMPHVPSNANFTLIDISDVTFI